MGILAEGKRGVYESYLLVRLFASQLFARHGHLLNTVAMHDYLLERGYLLDRYLDKIVYLFVFMFCIVSSFVFLCRFLFLFWWGYWQSLWTHDSTRRLPVISCLGLHLGFTWEHRNLQSFHPEASQKVS